MAASIHRNSIANCAFVTFPNGNEVGYRAENIPFIGAVIQVYFHQANFDGPNLFSNIGDYQLGAEFNLIDGFLTYAGMWDRLVPRTQTTWKEIANTKDYVSPFNGVVTTPGTSTVNLAMKEYLSSQDTAKNEADTDTKWFKAYLIGQIIQPAVNQKLAAAQIQVPPPVYQPHVYPPHQVGATPTMTDLFMAQCSRLKGVASGNTVIVGANPVVT